MKPKMIRQGDVLLICVSEPRETEAKPVADPRGVVLAEGETSGHHHAVFGRGAKLFRFRGPSAERLLVVGRGGAEIRVVGGESGGVPRHHPVQVAAGKYVVRTQREWSIEQERALQGAD